MHPHSTTPRTCACGCGSPVSKDHRWRRGHNPNKGNRPTLAEMPDTNQERLTSYFWQRVSKSENCWEWTGSRTPGGYGLFGAQIVIHGKRTALYAHRFSFQIHNGYIPKGHVVRHVCNNPSCVRPEHLITGTQKQNIADIYRKAEKPKRAKVYWPDVEELRSDMRDSVERIEAWAEKLGVKPLTVCDILLGRSWKHN
jgi:hypothetical protein